jgi:hypothetical protein
LKLSAHGPDLKKTWHKNSSQRHSCDMVMERHEKECKPVTQNNNSGKRRLKLGSNQHLQIEKGFSAEEAYDHRSRSRNARSGLHGMDIDGGSDFASYDYTPTAPAGPTISSGASISPSIRLFGGAADSLAQRPVPRPNWVGVQRQRVTSAPATTNRAEDAMRDMAFISAPFQRDTASKVFATL